MVLTPEENPAHFEKIVPPAPVQEKAPSNKARNHKIWLFTLILIVLGILFLLYWLLYLQFHESTDDAYANGNMINVNSAINGSVVAFYADDTDLVEEGQLLVSLDRTAYQVAYDKELASFANVVLQVRQLYDNVQMYEAIVANKQAALSKAKYDYDNRSRLIDSNAISNEDFIHSKDDLRIAETNLKQSEEQLKVAQDAAGTTVLEKHPLIEQQKNNVRAAYYNLQHTSVYSPATGYVAQRNVDVGESVNPQIDMMAVIPVDYVWVDANFKETQLKYMRVGQPATVWFDLYGSKVISEGKVLGIASGSGSVFSLIPPQNATGNWIKIVQRLPVRISLDPEMIKKYPVRLGISAEVDVDITNQDLPLLNLQPSKKVVGATKVFDINFDKVNQLMEKILHDNLQKETP